MESEQDAGFSEAELYMPVKRFFEALGYAVHGEVRGCDLTAHKDGRLVIVEFKKNFSLKLIYQAIDRQKMTEDVYVCIPRPKKFSRNTRRDMLGLVKRLGMGLMTVATDSPLRHVDVLVYPEHPVALAAKKHANKLTNKLMKEIAGRSADLNTGGANRVKINTAYRERAVKIACILERSGPLPASVLVAGYGCEKDAWRIVSRNMYGWFEKRAKGIYGLSFAGKEALNDTALNPLTDYYRAFAAKAASEGHLDCSIERNEST